MKSLTVRPPWAAAIFDNGKDVENRSWPTDYRGPVAILTGLRHDDRASELSPVPLPPATIVGAYIGVVDIVGCHLALDDCGCGPWALTAEQTGTEHTYHWMLDNPRRLRAPVNATGHLSLRDISTAHAARVLAHIPGSTR